MGELIEGIKIAWASLSEIDQFQCIALAAILFGLSLHTHRHRHKLKPWRDEETWFNE